MPRSPAGSGFLIGRTGEKQTKIPAQRAPVVNVAAPAAGPVAQATFTEDWPQGKDGFTVQIQVPPEASTRAPAVAQAKTDATRKGAVQVGALDSDQRASLDPGNYVVYSGVFDTKAQAAKAMKTLKANFPVALVIEVGQTGSSNASSGADSGAGATHAANPKLKELQKSSGKDYSKESAKLPPKVDTGGKAPPKDNKPAGGDSSGDATVIK